MDLSYSDEQRLLGESANNLLAARAQKPGATDLWKEMADMGWLALPLPEKDGGLGQGIVDVGIVTEAMGRHRVRSNYVASVVLAGGLVSALGNDAQRAALLPGLADGSLRVALAHAEEGVRYNLSHVTTTARQSGAGYVLDGRKTAALGGDVADRFIVSARLSGGARDASGIGLFVVDKGAKGATVDGHATVDGAGAARVTFDGVAVGAVGLVAEPQDGARGAEIIGRAGFAEARAALVTSGTATLETALFGVPEVVCYKASRISYEIGKRLIRIPYISLVNLIMNKPVVKELIQHDLTVDKLQQELELLLHNEERRRQLQQDYAELWQRLGEGGNASAKAAGLILFNLILIESLLSVDNAAVLATMVLDLPKEQRGKALKYGIIGAYLFRGVCLLLAAWIIKVWWLKPLGGLYLLWLAFDYFRSKNTEKADDDTLNKQESSIYKAIFGKIGPFWATVVLIEVMDLAFSIDNVLAVVAYTDNLYLIWIGVFIGILAMRFVAQGFVKLMEKFPFLETSAFLVIAVLGLKLTGSVFSHFHPDGFLAHAIDGHESDEYLSMFTCAIFFLPVLTSLLFNFPKKHIIESEK